MGLEHIFSLATTILGAVGTIAGFISWYFERRARTRIELETKRRIWTDISKVRGLMADLEKDYDGKKLGDGCLQAIGKLSFMMRDLIREACLAEKTLSVDTILKWRKAGKLASDWQLQLALNLLQSEEISLTTLEKYSIDFSRKEELPITHPGHAGLFLEPKNAQNEAH